MNENRSPVIGIDLGGTVIKGALVAPDGTILASDRIDTVVAEGYGAVVDRVASLVARLAKNSLVEAVGVGSPGAIDFERGTVVSSPNFPDWKEAPLRDDLTARLGMPVVLENDANAAALAERFAGAAQGWDDFVGFTLGTGVGSGLVLNGKLWRGPTGKGAEAGHLTVVPDGRLCGCGGRGCLEQYASATGVAQTGWERREESDWLMRRPGKEIDAKFINDGAVEGDESCRAILAEAGEALGKAMASVALLLDVTRFVVGGGMAPALPSMAPSARAAALAGAFTLTDEKLLILPSPLGGDAGLLGAASVALARDV